MICFLNEINSIEISYVPGATGILNSPFSVVIPPVTILFSVLLKNATVAYSNGWPVFCSITCPVIVTSLCAWAVKIDKTIKKEANKNLFMIVFLLNKTAKIEYGLVAFG